MEYYIYGELDRQLIYKDSLKIYFGISETPPTHMFFKRLDAINVPDEILTQPVFYTYKIDELLSNQHLIIAYPRDLGSLKLDKLDKILENGYDVTPTWECLEMIYDEQPYYLYYSIGRVSSGTSTTIEFRFKEKQEEMVDEIKD